MAGLISLDEIERVRAANDIVEVIADYIPLKRTGKSYKALCPFHQEKTASFNVSSAKQIFKCFGCGKGGNVFGFVMALEHVEFPEAVEILAKRAGLTLKREGVSGKTERRKENLYEVNLWAAKVYHRYLQNDECGAEARRYLEGRGFGREEQKRFRLGYCPDNWEFLIGLSGSKFPAEALVRTGLILAREGGGGREGGEGYYDRFRSRIMFPIFDARDRIVGFGGRILGEGTPKYLNSPETVLFDKSRCLYGLNWAKGAIAERRQALVVEGYTDCLTLFCHGIDWVVATLGTALTDEHVRQLRRYADVAVLIFDGDEAGQSAAERALEVFLAREMDVRVVLLPDGQDPADFVAQHGREGLLELIASAEEVFALKMKLVERRHDLETTSGKAAALDEILQVVAQAGSSVRQDILISNNPLLWGLSRQLDISETALRERLSQLGRRGRSVERPDDARRVTLREDAEWDILGVAMNRPVLAKRVFEQIKPGDFSEAHLREIAESVCETVQRKEAFELNDVLDRLHSEESIQLAVDLSEDLARRGKSEILLEAALSILKKDDILREGQRIQAAISEARQSGNEKRELELLREYQEHLRKRNGA